MTKWLQEFTEKLVNERVPAHRASPGNSCHESASEPRRKVVSGKLSIYTRFPKYRNCDICQRTQITRALCRRRTCEALPRTENFGDLITADHKVLNEEGEYGTITCTLWWYKIWILNGFNRIRVKPKLPRKLKRACKSSWSR